MKAAADKTLRPWHWAVGTLRAWTWQHTALGLLVGALALFNMGGALYFPPEFKYMRALTYNVLEFGLPYVFALRMADRAVADGIARSAAYGMATVGMIVIGVWVIGPILAPWIGGDASWNIDDDVALALGLLLPFSLATVAYAAWRAAQDTLARTLAADVGRADQERLVQSARLLALQARVEPQFLFDTLARVRRGLDQSVDAAERMLGDLIALLRAMQPVAGATASTVQREFELVQAYARASESAALQPPRLMLHAEPEVMNARLAPLVLLPALRALAGDAPQAQWQVGAARVGERLRIVVTPGTPDALAITALSVLDATTYNERVRAVHGPDARLGCEPGGAAPALLIDAPCILTSRPDDEHTRPDR
jgi:hypothetical protein